MREFYKLIEEKIKASGYPGQIGGSEFYFDVCDEIETRENGSYIYMIKKTDSMFYEGRVDVLDNQIDLHTLDIHEGDKIWHIDFDA